MILFWSTIGLLILIEVIWATSKEVDNLEMLEDEPLPRSQTITPPATDKKLFETLLKEYEAESETVTWSVNNNRNNE